MTSIEWLIKQISSEIEGEYWSNQQDITEYVEQAKEMHKKEMDDVYNHAFDYGVKSAKIELPSDEEIEKFASEFYDNNYADELIIQGAKWVIDKIKNQQ